MTGFTESSHKPITPEQWQAIKFLFEEPIATEEEIA